MHKYIGIYLISILISTISQIMLKKSADRVYKNKIREYLNVLVLLSYVLFFLSALMTTKALEGVPLKYAPIIESVGYIYILILSSFILKEKVTKNKLIGNIIIIIGIIIYSI